MPPEIVKNRWLGFLIWQSISSASVFLLYKSFLVSPYFSLIFFLSLLSFNTSLLIFSLSLFLITSPRSEPSAAVPELTLGFLRFFLRSIVTGAPSDFLTAGFRRRAKRFLSNLLFVLGCGFAGSLSVVSICGESQLFDGAGLIGLGLRGLVFGVVYGFHYVYRKRWVLQFPIIQRPVFFSFKMGLPSSLRQALKFSSSAFLLSTVLLALLPDQLKIKSSVWQFITQQIKFYIGTFVVSFCWELSHHLLQVVHTKRCIFAPSQGSAAAETNPSEPLLEALEQSTPRSLYQYLAYLDLCMVSESNVDAWRRAAFFEETGETYRRVISVSLRPLEELRSRLSEGLEGSSAGKSDLLSQQLCSPMDTLVDPRLHEAFIDFQLCTWCARTVAALTMRSHGEDRFGVAQLSGCNASVVSTLLSCLLAVEACLGKKTNPQPSHLIGPASIRFATVNTGRRDAPPAVVGRKRGGALYGKAYAMADVLRTSIYGIISVFYDEMQANAKATTLEKDWIIRSKPLYGTQQILVQKLGLFIDFRAC